MRRRVLLSASAVLVLGSSGAATAQGKPVRTRCVTDVGAFVIQVDIDVAPITVANYLAYVDGQHLDGGSVYRLVTLANQAPETRFRIEVVQWGLNLPDGKPAPFPPIAHETTRQTGLRHLDGTVSMARSTPGSATAEFFICIGPQPELDHGGRRNPDGQGFAAFGQVVEGMETVRAIHAAGSQAQYLAKPITVRTVRRV
jgi:peptidyl-prolyl cis-trans isomerase A (cyclophilin A)